MPRYFTVSEIESDRYSIACQREITISLCLQDCDVCESSRWKKKIAVEGRGKMKEMLLWWFMY